MGINAEKNFNFKSISNVPTQDLIELFEHFKFLFKSASMIKTKINEKNNNTVDCSLENVTYESLNNFEVAFLTQLELHNAFNIAITSLLRIAKLELARDKNV